MVGNLHHLPGGRGNVRYTFVGEKSDASYSIWRTKRRMTSTESIQMKRDAFRGEAVYLEKAIALTPPLLSKYFTVCEMSSGEPPSEEVYLKTLLEDQRRQSSSSSSSSSDTNLEELLEKYVFSRRLIQPGVLEQLTVGWEQNRHEPSIRQAHFEVVLGDNFEEVGLEVPLEILRAMNWPLDARFYCYDRYFVPTSTADRRILFRAPIQSGKRRKVRLSIAHLIPPLNAFSYTKQLSAYNAFGDISYQWRRDKTPWSMTPADKHAIISAGGVGLEDQQREHHTLHGGPGLRYLEICSHSKRITLEPLKDGGVGGDVGNQPSVYRYLLNAHTVSTNGAGNDILVGFYLNDIRLKVNAEFIYSGGYTVPEKNLTLRKRDLAKGALITSFKIYLINSRSLKFASITDIESVLSSPASTEKKRVLYEGSTSAKFLHEEDRLLSAFIPPSNTLTNGVSAEIKPNTCCTLVTRLGGVYSPLPKELFMTSDLVVVEVEVSDASRLLKLGSSKEVANIKLKINKANLTYIQVPTPNSLWDCLGALWHQHRILYNPADPLFLHSTITRESLQSDGSEYAILLPLFPHKSLTTGMFICVALSLEDKERGSFTLDNVYSAALRWTKLHTIQDQFPGEKFSPSNWKFVFGESVSTEQKSASRQRLLQDIHTDYTKCTLLPSGAQWTLKKYRNSPFLTFTIPKCVLNGGGGGMITDNTLYLDIKFLKPPTTPIHVTALLCKDKWIAVDSLGKVLN